RARARAPARRPRPARRDSRHARAGSRATRGCRRRRLRTGRAARRSWGNGQLDDERRALADDAASRDAPSVRLHDRLRDVEPEPRPRDLAVERALGTEEALEEMLTVAVGDPDPVILDLDRDLAVPTRHGQVDRPRLGAELDRVRDEVVDDLGEPAAV